MRHFNLVIGTLLLMIRFQNCLVVSSHKLSMCENIRRMKRTCISKKTYKSNNNL